jgi:DNA-binding NtrC family response regulator
MLACRSAAMPSPLLDGKTVSRIVVIDDDPDVQRTMADMLSFGGHAVILPKPGIGLFEAMGRAEFDAVVTDMVMPDINGWDVLQWIKANRPRLPVVLVSGELGNRAGVQVAAFDAYIAKPVRTAKLLDALARVLRPAKPSGEP